MERRACDRAPVDVADPAARLRLVAYVWADQGERLARLAGAVAIARAHGVAVEAADAARWVPERLAERAEGCTTVLFHSIMWHYMPESTRLGIREGLERAGERATARAPLAWLRFEQDEPTSRPELRLSLWPGRDDRLLATAQAHGKAVSWIGG